MALVCYHCGQDAGPSPVHSRVTDEERVFCCNGCLSAYLIIHEAGMDSYYRTRESFAPTSLAEAGETEEETRKRLVESNAYDLPAVFEEFTELLPGGARRVSIQIGRIQCASCVFLNESILKRVSGIYEARVNYETNRGEIIFDPDLVKISEMVRIINSIGYQATPLRPGQKSDQLKRDAKSNLWSMIVAGFCAGNIMLLSFALWSGFFSGSLAPEFKRLFEWLELLLATPVYFYAARTFHRGWKSFFRTGLAGMDVLISAGISSAYFYSVYVFLTGNGGVYFDSVATIVFIILFGRLFENQARIRHRERMEALVRPLPVHCMRLNARDEEEMISIKDLHRGDLIVVSPGDMLPADGVLLRDRCEIDESVLTGESAPVIRETGDRVLAGSTIVSGRAVYRVDSLPGESSLSALATLAEGVSSHESGLEKFTKRLIPIFSSIVILVSIGAFFYHYFWTGETVAGALTAAIAVLIVSCPCAQAISVPITVGAAIYLGIRKGILIRDGSVLESLPFVKTFYFDKTGTLTEGRPQVVDSLYLGDADEIESLTAKLEHGSPHPVGRALLEYVRKNLRDRGRSVEDYPPVLELPGRGIVMRDQADLRIGNLTLLRETGAQIDEHARTFLEKNPRSSITGLVRGGKVMALFALEDAIRPGASDVLRALTTKKTDVKILTGDAKEPSARIAAILGLPESGVHDSMLPEDKYRMIEEEKGKVCMIGDGYNDAVALSAADVSVVLSRGAPLSLEHAGIILLRNDLTGILRAQKIAKKTGRVVYLNLMFSLLYNSVMIPLAFFGLMLPIWCAIFMSASSLTVIISSSLFRLRGVK